MAFVEIDEVLVQASDLSAAKNGDKLAVKRLMDHAIGLCLYAHFLSEPLENSDEWVVSSLREIAGLCNYETGLLCVKVEKL